MKIKIDAIGINVRMSGGRIGVRTKSRFDEIRTFSPHVGNICKTDIPSPPYIIKVTPIFKKKNLYFSSRWLLTISSKRKGGGGAIKRVLKTKYDFKIILKQFKRIHNVLRYGIYTRIIILKNLITSNISYSLKIKFLSPREFSIFSIFRCGTRNGAF